MIHPLSGKMSSSPLSHDPIMMVASASPPANSFFRIYLCYMHSHIWMHMESLIKLTAIPHHSPPGGRTCHDESSIFSKNFAISLMSDRESTGGIRRGGHDGPGIFESGDSSTAELPEYRYRPPSNHMATFNVTSLQSSVACGPLFVFLGPKGPPNFVRLDDSSFHSLVIASSRFLAWFPPTPVASLKGKSKR